MLRQLVLGKEVEALGIQMCSGKTGPLDLTRVKVAEQRQFLDGVICLLKTFYIICMSYCVI